MSGFAYKTLTADHGAAWQALRIEGARDFPMGFLVTPEETRAISDARIRAILDGGSQRGVFDGHHLVGFCGYRPQMLSRTRHRAEIGPFFVTRSYQGTGAATAMMQGVVAEARASGLSQLELFVDTKNTRAIAFYERQGFVRQALHTDGVRIDGVSRDDHFCVLRLRG